MLPMSPRCLPLSLPSHHAAFRYATPATFRRRRHAISMMPRASIAYREV